MDLNLPPLRPPLYRGVVVAIQVQKLYFYEGGSLGTTYPVSTSLNPPSSIEDSGGTPLGWHRIAEKIGDGQPLGMVFKARLPQGKCFWEYPVGEANSITTRILRLQGVEGGVNLGKGVDSYQRFIYVHGTAHESRLGLPATHGCICMSNQAILELFAKIEEGDSVLIVYAWDALVDYAFWRE